MASFDHRDNLPVRGAHACQAGESAAPAMGCGAIDRPEYPAAPVQSAGGASSVHWDQDKG
ncbi:MAG: hypothetical protein JNK68_03330 [Betaproteobacteria bacterium]|nr:hypothetical protein [Betaproteobacteria bacterium]